jgi:hypothetical protein
MWKQLTSNHHLERAHVSEVRLRLFARNVSLGKEHFSIRP